MSISVAESECGPLVINISGRFDFSVHRIFRTVQSAVGAPGDPVVVDLSQTEYMDSSALGMLLMLRESAGGDGADITLRNCRSEVMSILNIANFRKLFKIG